MWLTGPLPTHAGDYTCRLDPSSLVVGDGDGDDVV